MRAQWLLTTTNQDPPIFTLQQLTNHMQKTSTHDSPPLMLQYENTDTWSDESPRTHTQPSNNNIIKQHIQLQTYIYAAQQIQWQHQDNMIT